MIDETRSLARPMPSARRLRRDTFPPAASDQAPPGKPPYAPGQILVKFKPQQDADLYAAAHGLKVIRHFEVPQPMQQAFGGELYQFRLPAGDTVQEALARFSCDPGVAYAEPNYLINLDDHQSQNPAGAGPTKAEAMPNDPEFGRLWGLKNVGQDGGTAGIDIAAPQAWAETTGKPNGQGPLIMIIDTGINYDHPDLKANVATLPNGTHGRNLLTHQDDPKDDNGHGSHCMGTIAGVGNNGIGVAGVNWSATVAGAKFLDAKGQGTYADAVDAVLYATRQGARLTSNSWGGTEYSQALHDAYQASPALHLCAAGNAASNADTTPSYPAGLDKDLDNIVSVAAIDRNGHLAEFSNYGARSVHLAAPGVDIYSTVLGDRYDTYSGTSMATPHVTGVAGLILSKFPKLTNEQLKARLSNSVSLEAELAGKVSSGGFLNAAAALKDDTTPPADITDLQVRAATSSLVRVGWTQPGDDGMTGGPSTVRIRVADRPIVDSPRDAGEIAWDDATPVAVLRADPGTRQELAIPVVPSDRPKVHYVAAKAFDGVGNVDRMAAVTASPQAAAMVLEDNFDTDSGMWTARGGWARVPAEGRGFVYRTTAQGPYPDNDDATLSSVPLDLSKVASPVLVFDDRIDVEAHYDFGRVEISDDGGRTWKQKAMFSGMSEWQTHLLNLAEYEGKTVQIRFHFTSDDTVHKDGWYLDNAAVAGDPKLS